MTYYILGSVVTALCLAGGFFLGWWARDRMRPAGEDTVPLVEAPLADPIDIPIAGRHIPPKR